MMSEEIRFSCPLDCPNSCAMLAVVNDGIITEVKGDRKHPDTRGLICLKGKQHLYRLYHRDRLLSPRKKLHDKWVNISYEEALGEIAEKLVSIKQKYGSQAVLHYYDYGYCGMSKTVDQLFFNYYGGATVHTGGLCHQAGLKAQEYDMGTSRAHHPADLINSGVIIVWGRNPADTSVHFARYLNQTKKKGVKIYLIDPLCTNTAKMANEHIAIKPGTDGVLALGMARIIIEENLADIEFIKNCTLGFTEFADKLKLFTPEYVESVTGITPVKVRELAVTYAANKPAAICLGYGVQRYSNGGNNIRAIDALGAITGNIGISGGGVNYTDTQLGSLIGSEFEKSLKFAANRRAFTKARFADFVLNADNPPVKMLFVTRANPLVQLPDVNKTIKAFENISFKVTVDMFMTDTARHSDLVLPATSIFEEEDLFNSGDYVNYSHKVIKPLNGIIGEYGLFQILAQKVGLSSYPLMERNVFFQNELRQLLKKYNLNLAQLKENYFVRNKEEIPWKERAFETPSGKYEFYSEKAAQDGISPLPVYIPVHHGSDNYPLRLLTPHYKGSLHSQNFAFTDEKPVAHINMKTLAKYKINIGEFARVSSENGEIKVRIEPDEKIPDDTIMIYQGWWHKSGSVNCLIPDAVSDMGELAAYFECFCRIE